MKKGVLIASGIVAGLALLVGVSLATGVSVVRAAARVGQSLSHIVPALSAAQEDEQGVVIISVEKDGPAAQAGVKRGDILLKVGDTEVNTPADVAGALRDLEPGDKVTLTILHGDDQQSVTVTLGDRNGTAILGLTPFGLQKAGARLLPGETFSATKGMTTTQVMVTEVVTDSPAAKAGLKKGDLIISIDGTQLGIDKTLSDVIASHKPGDTVTLEVMSPAENSTGTSRQVQVQLGENPDKEGVAWLGVRYTQNLRGFKRGMPFPNIPNVKQAVVIRDVTADSPAETAGLKQGDVITAVNGEAVSTPQALVEVIAGHKPGDQITLSVQRSDTGSDAKSIEIKVTLGENPDKEGAAWLGVSVGGGFGGFRFRMKPSNDGQGMQEFQLPGLDQFFERIQPYSEKVQPLQGDTL